MRELLRRIFGPRFIAPVAVRAGDDIILTARNWPASEDIATFLNAAQAQFPLSRIHLITGVDRVQIHRNESSGQGEDPGNDGGQYPRRALSKMAADAAQTYPDMAEQGNVLLLRKLSGIGIVAVSVPVPPKEESDSVEELHLHLPAENDISNSRCAQLSLLAGDILRDTRPGLFGSDDGPRLRRLLARKMRSAAVKFLANHKEVNHA